MGKTSEENWVQLSNQVDKFLYKDEQFYKVVYFTTKRKMRDATIIDEVGGGGTGGGDEASLHHLLSSDPEFQCKYSGNLDLLFPGSSDHSGSLPPEEGLDSSGDHQLLQHYHSSTTSSLSAAVDDITSKSRNTSFCPRDWDNLICWPETMAGQMATLPCFDELNGIFYDTTRK